MTIMPFAARPATRFCTLVCVLCAVDCFSRIISEGLGVLQLCGWVNIKAFCVALIFVHEVDDDEEVGGLDNGKILLLK